MPTNNDVTHRENPLEATLTEDEGTEDSYRERIVGKTKRVQERGAIVPQKRNVLYVEKVSISRAHLRFSFV